MRCGVVMIINAYSLQSTLMMAGAGRSYYRLGTTDSQLPAPDSQFPIPDLQLSTAAAWVQCSSVPILLPLCLFMLSLSSSPDSIRFLWRINDKLL